MSAATKCALVYLRASTFEDGARAREELRAAVAPLGWRVLESPDATDALRAVIAHWPGSDGAVLTARELVELARADAAWRDALFAWCPPRAARELPTARSVGCRLHRARGMDVDGYVLDVAKRDRGGRAWVRRKP